MPQQHAGMAEREYAPDLESGFWEFESLSLYNNPSNPTGRDNGLKIRTVLVRVQGGVQLGLWCNGEHSRVRSLGYGFKSYRACKMTCDVKVACKNLTLVV